MSKQRSNGEAFEFACLEALQKVITEQDGSTVSLIVDDYYEKCRASYESLDPAGQEDKRFAAEAGIRMILPLEPHLMDNDMFTVSLQHDNKGEEADVRDVLCAKNSSGWEIGFSCKNNHEALKHPRLSPKIDFGKKWMGCPCSPAYWEAIAPIFAEIENLIAQDVDWKNISDKDDRFYRPLLDAFIDEVKRIYEKIGSEAPRRMLRYLIGSHDFYKLISNDKKRVTTMMPFNFTGKLGQTSEGRRSKIRLSTLHLPTEFQDIKIKRTDDGEESKSTAILYCDKGWTVSLRLHNAKTKAERSLKFDAQLIGHPTALTKTVEAWEERKAEETPT